MKVQKEQKESTESSVRQARLDHDLYSERANETPNVMNSVNLRYPPQGET